MNTITAIAYWLIQEDLGEPVAITCMVHNELMTGNQVSYFNAVLNDTVVSYQQKAAVWQTLIFYIHRIKASKNLIKTHIDIRTISNK